MIGFGAATTVPDAVALLLLQHPAVTDAVVLPVPDDTFGQRLRAFVTTRPGVEISEPELREFLVTRFEMPRDILITSSSVEFDTEPVDTSLTHSNMTSLSEYRLRHRGRR